jgi:hypothetical protein
MLAIALTLTMNSRFIPMALPIFGQMLGFLQASQAS